MKLIINPEYNLYERSGKAFCDSLQIAESFGKAHDNVLRDIRNTIVEAGGNFSLLNFEESKYKSRGKSYPKYYLTKDGFTLLVMGYTGKKAMEFKIAYINRFNEMEEWIKSLLSTKMEFPAFTEAVMLAHDEPKFYHFSNEINMIYRIVLGMDAKTYKQQNGLHKDESLRPHLSLPQIRAIESLQRFDIGLLVVEPNFEQRKTILRGAYQKMLPRLSA